MTREGDKTKRKGGPDKSGSQERVDHHSARDGRKSEEMRLIAQVFSGKCIGEDDEEKCGGGPQDGEI